MVKGLPGKCIGKWPIIKHNIPRASVWAEGFRGFGYFLKTFHWKSLAEIKVRLITIRASW